MNTNTLVMIHSEHYEAIVESYVLIPKSHEVCMLSITGQPDAIKALRASLSMGLKVTMSPNNIVIDWPKQPDTIFTFLQKRLPSGVQAALWLPQRGTSVGIQHDTRAYIIDRHYQGAGPPAQFIRILDRVLPCPLLDDWAEPLWTTALQQKWVLPLESYNCSAWVFEPMTTPIIAWVQHHLTRHQPTA